ncbi:MAG: DUF2147 domain-containing protein [Treponema sp.]|jgi:uncharacterized protein (DUF2147 family)|nr:DUF2147 domain-containing protein [Treponema sp.]
MMKACIVVCLMAALTPGLCFADPVEGFWLSVDDKTNKATAGWEIYQQGGKLYGRILSIAGFPQEAPAMACKESYPGFPAGGKVNEMRVVGTSWIFGLTMDKAGQWSGGNVIDPNDGKMYKCKITFRPADGKRYPIDTLEMRGEIGLGIGRSQFWRRSTRTEAGGLR